MVNLMGRVSMPPLECLFSIAEELLDKFKEEKKSNKERLDFYVRAMSREQAMGWYLDAPVGGVFGSQRTCRYCGVPRSCRAVRST